MSVWLDVLEDLGDPIIFLVPVSQFEQIASLKRPGYRIGDSWGDSDRDYRMVTVVPRMKPRARKNTMYHEALHLLFPHWEHWRIELSAQVLAGGGGKGEWTKITGHDICEVGTRNQIRSKARRASKRYNAKTTTRRRKGKNG